MVKNIFFALYIFLLALPFSADAQSDVRFYVDVSPKAGGTDETFIFSVVIENAQGAVTPFLLGGDDFEVRLLGPRQSTTIVNGDVTTQLAYNYSLRAKHEGLLETPSAEIEIAGKKYTADALQVKVSKSLNPAPPPGNSNTADQAVFLKQNIEKNTLYIGEQVQHTSTLYASTPIYDAKFSEATLDGFWSEDIGEADKTSSVYNNRNYTLFRWRKALYPTRSGTIEIAPRKLEAKLRLKSRMRAFPFGQLDPFDDIDSFIGRAQFEEHTFSSDPLTLEVKQLPTAPNDFNNWGVISPLVGDSKLSLEYSNAPVKSGESKTLKLQIESYGNLGPYSNLPLSSNADFRFYQEASEDKKTEVGGKLRMQRIIRFSIIPLKPGDFEYPAIKLGYFDAISETYKEASTEEIKFEVSGSDLREKKEILPSQNKVTNLNIPEPDATVTESTPPPLKYEEEGVLKKLSSQVSLSLSLMFLATVTLFVFAFNYLQYIKRSRLPLEKSLNALQNCKNAECILFQLRSFFSQKLSVKLEAAQGENLRALLSSSMRSQDLLYKAQNLLDELDEVIYGKTKDLGNLESLKRKSLEIMRDY